jgi:hypothetical protein
MTTCIPQLAKPAVKRVATVSAVLTEGSSLDDMGIACWNSFV